MGESKAVIRISGAPSIALLVGVFTAACTASFMRVWLAELGQLWAAGLAAITLSLGGYWTYHAISRWHMIEFTKNPHLRFQVRNPIGRTLDLSLVDVVDVELLEREVFGLAQLHGQWHRERTELILTRSNAAPIVITAVRPHTQNNLRELAGLVALTTIGREPSTTRDTTTQRGLHDGIPPEALWLNAEPSMAAVSASVFVATFLLFGAFVSAGVDSGV